MTEIFKESIFILHMYIGCSLQIKPVSSRRCVPKKRHETEPWEALCCGGCFVINNPGEWFVERYGMIFPALFDRPEKTP